MNGRQFAHEHPHALGHEFWIAIYNYKGNGSSFMYEHVKPTPAICTFIGTRGNPKFQCVSERTGAPKAEYRTISYLGYDGIFTNKEDCIEFYKSRIQHQIENCESYIKKHEEKIVALREKMNSL